MASGDNLVLGKNNTASDLTLLQTSDAGVVIFTESDGLAATSLRHYGLYGQCTGLPDITDEEDPPAGVVGFGENTATGVRGISGGGVGVDGQGARIGVLGHTDAFYGVGFGVVGIGRGQTGVYGHSDGWTGVVGSTGDPWGNYAGYFWGPVGVNGNLTVWGKKSAAVPFPDGSHRLLYAVESPESWFEDFGTARLVRGRARVKIDRQFASVVRLAGYHVFLSPEGDSRGLYVRKKTKDAFEVREQQGGSSSLRFSFRIVAQRKDVSVKRFARVALPKRPPIPKVSSVRMRPIRRRRNVSSRLSRKRS